MVETVTVAEAFEYTLVRNVPATNDHGDDALICVALIRWPNGYTESLAINEDMIEYRAGGKDPMRQEQVIAEEVRSFVTRR